MATSAPTAKSLAPGDSPDSHLEKATKDGRSENAPPAEKPSIFQRAWAGTGLNVGMLKLMTKGALPPTISLAMYESTPFAEIYSTLGYLVAIMSVLSFAILPRSKFIQTMLLNVIAICIGAAVALLGIYCSVQARVHTTGTSSSTSNGPSPGAAVVGYNSSASAVCAIWLFFNIYVVNTLRASRPQLQFPVIVYSIFSNVAFTYAPSFPNMAAGIAFAKRLLEAFLTGFGVATGVSLFIFPMTARMGFFKQSAGFIAAVQGTIKAQSSYLQSLETEEVFRPPPESDEKKIKGKSHENDSTKSAEPLPSAETQTFKAAIGGLGELYGKMNADLTFAKRELAFGKLNGSDMDELLKLFQEVMTPIMGMSSTTDIFERIAKRWGWTEPETVDTSQISLEQQRSYGAKAEWNAIMKTLNAPFETITEAMHDGLEHALFTLELAKTPQRKDEKDTASKGASQVDVEADAGVVRPGDKGYAVYLTQKVAAFHEQREKTLNLFCQLKGFKMGPSPFANLSHSQSSMQSGGESLYDDSETHQRNKRQLYLILYMEFLLWSTGRAVLNLVHFADQKVEDGTMKKRRLIRPGMRRLKKWLSNLLKEEDSTTEHTPDAAESGGVGVYSGASFQVSKDPEHLPPANTWQRFGNAFRKLGDILGSMESVFGFRVACATLSIGIVAYLKDTRDFFLTQRIVWALIMVSIGMTLTAGSGVFGFVGRIVGTFVAMCTSLAIWYIVNGHAAGVIVLLFIFVFLEFYFLLKYPRFVVVALLSIVTQVLIIGYELEVKKVGIAVASSNGQPYYQIYLLAPYRLACVSGGMFVAFFWTFFPYPLTARSQLRKDLGVSLYLLANFYSIVHTAVGLRLTGREGDMEWKESPGKKLEKARRQVYAKELALLAGLRTHSAFTAWEPSFGGKFPRGQYDIIIEQIQNILNYMILISYASNSFIHDPSASPEKATWNADFARLVSTIGPTSQEITSTLALLSSAVTNGNPLPPYLKSPQPYQLSARLEELDSDILSISHVTEPGYSAFAVMQIASSLISDDLGKLIEGVKELVGEVDFSFHAISTSDESEDSLLNKEGRKGKRD